VANKEHTTHDTGIGWAILLVCIAVLLWLLWYYYDVEIRDGIRWIRYWEMWLVSWFVGDDYTVIFSDQPTNWRKGFEDTPLWKPEQLKYEHLSYFTALAMQPYQMVFISIMGVMACWCMFLGPGTAYRKHLGLEDLMERQAEVFPVIAPFISFNPSTQPARPPGSPVPAELPLFAEALGPEEWLAYHEVKVEGGKIDEAEAARAFEKQLIGRWKGPMALQPYQQILLAAFALKSARKRKEADEILGRIAKCWSAKDGLRLGRDSSLLREARKILKDDKISGRCLAEANRHAFVASAMLRALAFAREEGGVMAPAQFVWLRGHDRTLWYPLNNLGRQSFHMEALGAMSHYKAERMTKRPIPVPKVENGVKTIQEYMASNRARPIPPIDNNQSKSKHSAQKAA
jgi:intracellular multiplication protein IcmP